MSIEWLSEKLSEQGIELSNTQKEQFQKYYKLLVEWNKKMNLTSITDEHDVYLKHFYDSIAPSFYYDFNGQLSLCDIGAGAGFPSIPLKIVYPRAGLPACVWRYRRPGCRLSSWNCWLLRKVLAT